MGWNYLSFPNFNGTTVEVWEWINNIMLHFMGMWLLIHGDVIWCRRTWQSLVDEMAWCLFGAKPLPEPMVAYCQIDPQEHTSMKSESKYFFAFLNLDNHFWEPHCATKIWYSFNCREYKRKFLSLFHLALILGTENETSLYQALPRCQTPRGLVRPQ